MKRTPLKRGTKQLKRSWLKRKPPKKKAKRPRKTTLRNKCDKLVGLLCRSRGKCEFCGSRETLQWAHFITRAIIHLRYDPDNYACLCAACHFRGHKDPEWFRTQWNEKRGEGSTQRLSRMSNDLPTITEEFFL